MKTTSFALKINIVLIRIILFTEGIKVVLGLFLMLDHKYLQLLHLRKLTV